MTLKCSYRTKKTVVELIGNFISDAPGIGHCTRFDISNGVQQILGVSLSHEVQPDYRSWFDISIGPWLRLWDPRRIGLLSSIWVRYRGRECNFQIRALRLEVFAMHLSDISIRPWLILERFALLGWVGHCLIESGECIDICQINTLGHLRPVGHWGSRSLLCILISSSDLRKLRNPPFFS